MSEYRLQPMSEWSDLDADLAIVDPPFGIDFGGSKSNYRRDSGRVVDGYVEWESDEYESRVNDLLDCIEENLATDGSALIFSGWNNSHVIARRIVESEMNLKGKMYWSYNFAPYCQRRPAHNVYELFWVTQSASSNWYYTNECRYDHCQEGEANLSHFHVKREYHQEVPKYPTRLPIEVVEILLDHYSQRGDMVFDPCAGSGVVGVAAKRLGREWCLGDVNTEGKQIFHQLLDHYETSGTVGVAE